MSLYSIKYTYIQMLGNLGVKISCLAFWLGNYYSCTEEVLQLLLPENISILSHWKGWICSQGAGANECCSGQTCHVNAVIEACAT